MTGSQAVEEAVEGSCAFRPFVHDKKPTPAHSCGNRSATQQHYITITAYFLIQYARINPIARICNPCLNTTAHLQCMPILQPHISRQLNNTVRNIEAPA